MLAKEFHSYINSDDIIIFASGVSNSKETDESEFKREKGLLEDTINANPLKKIIYFSTCSMYDNYFKHNKYTLHKLEMEAVIEKLATNYLIIRLPQVVGANNKHQLMGFLYDSIDNNKPFDLYNIDRNIIDIFDIKKIVDFIVDNTLYSNKTINVANPENINVLDLVKKIEKMLNKKALYKLVALEGSFIIDTSEISFIIKELKLFNDRYTEQIIKSYYE